MVKNLNKSILVIALTLLPTTQPIQARSGGGEAIFVGVGVALVATLGWLGWRYQNNSHELAQQNLKNENERKQQAQVYAKEQSDKNSINEVITIDPTRDLYEIVQLLDQARLSETSFEQFVAEYCSRKALSIDALYSNLEAYTRQAEHAVAQLKTNHEFWSATQAPLASQANEALNDPRLQHNIQTLQMMCQNLKNVKEYARLYCAYKQIATRSYPYDGDQFPLICVVNDINNDLEILSQISYKLNGLSGYDYDTSTHRIDLAHTLAYTISDLITRKDNIAISSEYQQQKSAHFILQQQQDEADRIHKLEKQRLEQAKEADRKAYELEERRVNLEKTRIENEREALKLKNLEWDELRATIRRLRDEIQKLTYDKNTSQNTIDNLRFELARLRDKYITLERERSREAGPAH